MFFSLYRRMVLLNHFIFPIIISFKRILTFPFFSVNDIFMGTELRVQVSLNIPSLKNSVIVINKYGFIKLYPTNNNIVQTYSNFPFLLGA